MTSPSVRGRIQDGEEDYQVTSGDMPSFLYDDPENYDPDDVLAGFMRGFFLARVHIHYLPQSERLTCSSAYVPYSKGHGRPCSAPPLERRPLVVVWRIFAKSKQ